MTMLSPLGRVPRRRPNRRSTPALVTLSVLVVVAIVVWWRVFHPSDGSGTRAAACAPNPDANVAKMDPKTVQVRVYNSTDQAGLAKRVSDELAKRGFTVTATSNDPVKDSVKGVAEIRYGPDGAQQAAFLSFHVPGATLLIDNRTGPAVDVALGDQYKALAPPANAQKAAQQAAQKAQDSPDLSSRCASIPDNFGD